MNNKTFYFTYGTSESFPFSKGWTEVIAPDKDTAIKLFNILHKPRFDCTNASFIYSEEEFKETSMFKEGNLGKFCRERISLNSELLTDEYMTSGECKTYVHDCKINSDDNNPENDSISIRLHLDDENLTKLIRRTSILKDMNANSIEELREKGFSVFAKVIKRYKEPMTAEIVIERNKNSETQNVVMYHADIFGVERAFITQCINNLLKNPHEHIKTITSASSAAAKTITDFINGIPIARNITAVEEEDRPQKG